MTDTQNQSIINANKSGRLLLIPAVLILTVAVALSGWMYLRYRGNHIQIDKAVVSAPKIDLAAAAPGTLQEMNVHAGDQVPANTVVARVDNQLVKTNVAGQVISVNSEVGKRTAPNEALISMIDPNDLRVIGQIDENKGLKDIRVGQSAAFTVDAFGSRKFYGVVDSISPTSHDSGIVFSISDKRETKTFDIKIRYKIAAYPELKNGMSAKIDITK